MERSASIFKRIDWWTVLLYLILVISGWLNIYAAVYNKDFDSIFDISQKYGKQLLWISIALLLIVIIFIIDGNAFEFISYPVYILALLMLIFVLLFGSEIKGARSWFELGSFRVQPSEFAKLTTALALSRCMSELNFKLSKKEDILKAALIIFLPMSLIVLQNDTGSALVYLAFIIVLFREGLSPIVIFLCFSFVILFITVLMTDIFYVFIALSIILFLTLWAVYNSRHINKITIIYMLGIATILSLNQYVLYQNRVHILGFAIILGLIIFFYPAYVKKLKHYATIAIFFILSIGFTMSVEYLFHNILEKHQRTRINVVLGLESDPQGVGYNVNQSKIAIGSGGVTGKGFLQGTQTKYDFVPEQDTDFIFCTVGEEWGFLGSSAIIILFALLLTRIIIISERQRVKMHRIYGYCVASILFFHIVVNIGMTIGITPVIGIPLPFFSYGGSSLWAFTILLFILLKFDSVRMDRLF